MHVMTPSFLLVMIQLTRRRSRCICASSSSRSSLSLSLFSPLSSFPRRSKMLTPGMDGMDALYKFRTLLVSLCPALGRVLAVASWSV